MQLSRPLPSQPTTVGPTYLGLRVSSDREFSAPQYATVLVELGAGTAMGAAVEAQELLAAGRFDGSGSRDAARSVAILRGPEGAWMAGSIVERRFGGRFEPVAVTLRDPNFEYWYEDSVGAVASRDDIELIER